MLKPLAGTGFLLLLLAPPALAQEPDTTSAWRYFPLQVGNVWEYVGTGPIPTARDYRLTIEADTLIGNTRYYVAGHDGISCSPCIERSLVRFDPSVGMVVARTNDGQDVRWWYAPCPLDTPFETEVVCYEGGLINEVGGGYEETVELADGTVLEGVTYKTFSGSNLLGYVAGIGFVTKQRLQYEPGGSVLVYARVGGVEYGTPFEVSAEAAAPVPASALRVYPNPLRGEGVVELTLGEPQHAGLAVYDVLGRRVLRLHEGPLPAGSTSLDLDAGALAPGVYFVRAAGADAATFTATR